MSKVVLGMSGGVDSSVTAHLLCQAGYEVVGLFMKNWEEGDFCSAQNDFLDVAKVADQLGIPHYAVNFSKDYKERVFNRFLADLAKGRTPNPDVLCNQEIKFKVFFEKAVELGADFIATGHYAKSEGGGLFCADDPAKDQSYFLYRLKKEVLSRTLMPLGKLLKSQVREIARSLQLAVANKRDSTGICFIGKRDFREFLGGYFEKKPGPILTLEGNQVGIHQGLFNYTIGQRKGIGIGGSGPSWFVVKKDVIHNCLYVVQGEEHPALYTDRVVASDESWISGEAPALPCRMSAKIRYRTVDVGCQVERTQGGGLIVHFDRPVKAATSGQSIVFYKESRCLGGAIIDS